jgi:hypothetical protein
MQTYYLQGESTAIKTRYMAGNIGGLRMHAFMAYLNGVGSQRRSGDCRAEKDELELLRTLLRSPSGESHCLDKGKAKDERQAKLENQQKPYLNRAGTRTILMIRKKPVRERHLKKANR